MFGLPMPPSIRYWGARAIYKDGYIDLLPNRQTYDGENEEFTQWLNVRALPWLRSEVQKINLDTNDPQILTLSEFKYELKASTNASYGYLYIGAVEHKQTPTEPIGKEEIVVINGQSFVVDKRLVPLGTKGKIVVNEIGPATVVGYFNEKYINNCLLACLLVQLEEPPKWWIDQTMRYEAEKLVKSGILPKAKGTCGNYPAERSKAYREWKKEWKPSPMPLLCSDFQPN